MILKVKCQIWTSTDGQVHSLCFCVLFLLKHLICYIKSTIITSYCRLYRDLWSPSRSCNKFNKYKIDHAWWVCTNEILGKAYTAVHDRHLYFKYCTSLAKVNNHLQTFLFFFCKKCYFFSTEFLTSGSKLAILFPTSL